MRLWATKTGRKLINSLSMVDNQIAEPICIVDKLKDYNKPKADTLYQPQNSKIWSRVTLVNQKSLSKFECCVNSVNTKPMPRTDCYEILL